MDLLVSDSQVCWEIYLSKDNFLAVFETRKIQVFCDPFVNLSFCCVLFDTMQTSGGGKSSQDIIEELASDILSKLPPEFNLEEVQVCVKIKM